MTTGGSPPRAVARRAGRHARLDRPHDAHTPPDGYRARHAVPEADTVQFVRVLAAPATPAPVTSAPPVSAAPDRVRVVLAERRSPTRAVRTVAEIEQQTETGEFLLTNLMRAQLSLGVRLGLVAALVLGGLPVLFLVAPRLGDVGLLGVRAPWLLLGIAPYPFLLVLGWLYTHYAERNELDFAENVED